MRSKIAGISIWAWLVFAAGTLSLPLGYTLLSRNDTALPATATTPAYVNAATQKGITAVQHDVADIHTDVADMNAEMHARFNAEDKTLRKVKNEVSHMREAVDTQNVTIQGLEQKTDDNALAIRQIAAVSAFHQKMNDDRMAQVQYATALSAANTMPKEGESTKPKTFSYFQGQEWAQQLHDMNNWMNSVGFFNMINMGTPEKNAVRFEREEDVILDGFGYRNIEEYDVANKLPNGITVLAPGLMGLKDDTLQIDGDVKIDTVTLDGCLNWQKIKKDDRFTYWKATDPINASRTVLIGDGIQTDVEAFCDNRYLLWRQQKGASKLMADPTRSRYEFSTGGGMENLSAEGVRPK